MEDSVEVVIEKLLNATKDVAPKVNSHLDEVIMLKISLPSFLMCYIVQVANEAEHCLTMVLSLYDPFRCLSVSSCVSFEFAQQDIWISSFHFSLGSHGLFAIPISDKLLFLQVVVPLLVTEDEKTLVTCINCLTKVIC